MAFSLTKRWAKKFLEYFKKTPQSKDETDSIQVTNVLTSVAENVTSAELAYAEENMQKTCKRPKRYQVKIPAKIKKEVELFARDFGAVSAIKKIILNIGNILLSEPQLTPGRSARIVTGPLSRELEDPTC